MIRRLLWSNRLKLIGGVFLSCLGGCLSFLLVVQLNGLVSAPGAIHLIEVLRSIGTIAALGLVTTSYQLLLSRCASALITGMRTEIALKLMAVEYEVFLEKRISVSVIVDDMARIAPLLQAVPQLIYSLVVVSIISGYLLYLSPTLFGVLAAFLGTSIAISVRLNARMRSRFDALRSADETVSDCFRTICEGRRELSLGAVRREYFLRRVLQPALTRGRAQLIGAHFNLAFFNAWTQMILYGAIFLVAYLGYAVTMLSVGTVASFIVATLFITGPTSFVVAAVPQLALASASLRRLGRAGVDITTDHRIAPDHESKPIPTPWKNIRANSVTFKYRSEESILEQLGPIDLLIERGDIVFVTGDNGSGKSTLLMLLCGLLRPSSGDIFVDNRAVFDDIDLYRSRLGAVFYDFFLFPQVLDSTGESLPDAELHELLNTMGLSGKVASHQGHLQTQCLSSGQRRRMAFIQCYSENCDIYAFDEWASDQDSQFREFFYRTLIPRLKHMGKTVLVVSHDDRYFHVADRLIRLQGGRIVSEREVPSHLPVVQNVS